MAIITNSLGIRFSGRIGKGLVAASWKGTDYVREYVKPRDRKTEDQRRHRAIFRTAAEAWHALTDRQREFFDRIASKMSGYNLFIGRYVVAVRGGCRPEVPLVVRWRVKNRKLPEEVCLKVHRHGKLLFTERLDARKGEVALTESDGPYTFTLVRKRKVELLLDLEQLPMPKEKILFESEEFNVKMAIEVRIPRGK